MTIEEIIGDKRQAILRLAAQYGASQVRVFGSLARGEAGPDSDIDFLVSFPDTTSVFDVIGLWLALKDLLGREVDVLTEGGLDDRMKARILKDAVPL